MSVGIETKEGLFAVMEQIAAEREAARPIVEKLVASNEPVDDIEIPEGWRTAGFVLQLILAAGSKLESNPSRTLTLTQLALTVACCIPKERYPSPIPSRLEGQAWKEIGYAQFYLSAYETALRAYDTARNVLLRESALVHDVLVVQFSRALVIANAEPFADSLSMINDSILAFRSYGDERHLVQAECIRGIIYFLRGEYDAARKTYEELLGVADNSDDLHTLATNYTNLGRAYGALGRTSDATAAYKHGRAIFEALGFPAEIDRTDWATAKLLLGIGEFASAVPILRRLRESFLMRRQAEEAGFIALDLVEAFLALGKREEAGSLTAQVVAEFISANLNRQAVTALSYLHDVLPRVNKPARAVGHVRTYLNQLKSEPSRLFLPLEDERP
jgi:tetratricopeptide (TPR) repeat protein